MRSSGAWTKELDQEEFLDLLEEVEIHLIDMLIRVLRRKNPDRAGRVRRLLDPLRTRVRAVRFGTPPDFEDFLVEVRNRRLGSVILSYHQLVALMAQAKRRPTSCPVRQCRDTRGEKIREIDAKR